jgi:uncharacterized protein YndB with AHSA1/START domain
MTGTNRKLIVTTPSDLEIVMTREINAPRQLVYEAHTRPEHLRHWWGPRKSELVVCEIDFRPGGAYRFVLREPDGDYGFRGEFREIVPPERITWTFEYEGMPGHTSVETMTFTEYEGRTTIHVRSVYDSVEDRDAMLQSGMEVGAGEIYDRLEEHLHLQTRR